MNFTYIPPKTAIQHEIARMQEAEPDLTFQSAWDRLRKQKPQLFSHPPARITTDYEPSPEQARAAKISRAQRVIHAACEKLQEEGLTFQAAWDTVKRQRPELFAALIQAADPLATARVVKAVNYSPDYIMLRAEDADQLERKVAAGLWKD
jgi:hypothetical protein